MLKNIDDYDILRIIHDLIDVKVHIEVTKHEVNEHNLKVDDNYFSFYGNRLSELNTEIIQEIRKLKNEESQNV